MLFRSLSDLRCDKLLRQNRQPEEMSRNDIQRSEPQVAVRAHAVWGWLGYREDIYYPQKAVTFLSENKRKGELFAPYGWGGYLVWKLPAPKVFVDGRMPTFTWNAPPGESDNALAEYVELSQGKNVAEIFAKYRVKTALLPAPREITPLQAKLYTHLRALSLVKGKETTGDLFTTVLEKQGWHKIYLDQTAVIYTSPE